MHIEHPREIGNFHLGKGFIAQDAGIRAQQIDASHSLVARATMALTCSKLETSAPSAIATPPDLRISSTTFSAGVSEPPLPSRVPPKSLATTFAPRLASPSACARPRPLPAPVTIATRPSNLIVMIAVPSP